MAPDNRSCLGDEYVNEDVRLKRGTDVNYALEVLSSLRTKGNNIAQGGGQFGRIYNDYLMWVEEAEAQLRSLFTSSFMWQELYTERYWRIRQMDIGRPVRPMPLITSEASWQVERLDAVLADLRHLQRSFELPQGALAIVPDANLFAHYRRYDEIDWPTLVDAKAVHLVLPLAVLDELDALSYKSREGGHTAAGVIRAVQRLRGNAHPETPIKVRPNVALQILMDPPRHIRQANVDDEILSRAEYLAALVNDRVVVASGDYGMQLRSQARGLGFLSLPHDLRLRTAEEGESVSDS